MPALCETEMANGNTENQKWKNESTTKLMAQKKWEEALMLAFKEALTENEIELILSASFTT